MNLSEFGYVSFKPSDSAHNNINIVSSPLHCVICRHHLGIAIWDMRSWLSYRSRVFRLDTPYVIAVWTESSHLVWCSYHSGYMYHLPSVTLKGDNQRLTWFSKFFSLVFLFGLFSLLWKVWQRWKRLWFETRLWSPWGRSPRSTRLLLWKLILYLWWNA